MKWITTVFFLMATQALALTPILNDYGDKNDVYMEFRNLYDQAQDRQFTQVVGSTPNYTDLRDGEIVIYVSTPALSTTDIRLMLRIGTTIYSSPTFPVMKGR